MSAPISTETVPGPYRAPLIDLRNVTRTVKLPSGGLLPILTGIDLQVFRGEHVAILGRSGSGKTTLLNLLGMIDRPTSGEIYYQEVDTARLDERARARLRGGSVGFVFQQFNLHDARTALDNVAMPLLYGNAHQFWNRKKLALDMLDHVGLADRAHQRPTRLSGGEQQRIAVARALVRRPSLLLADEPTGALDVATGEAVMNLLATAAREEDAALITITHDLHVASLADRVLLLQGGTLRPVSIEEAGAALAASPGIRASRPGAHARRTEPPTDTLVTVEGE